jgi:hypothetical protein
MGRMTVLLWTLLVAIIVSGCNQARATSQEPVTVTSAGSPTDPVPVEWSIHRSYRLDGHRLLLQGGTIHAIPSEARLIGPDGKVVAAGPARPLGGADERLCDSRRGLVRADLRLPAAELPRFEGDWPAGYRVEVRVGGKWRPTQLSFAGCRSTE